MRKLLFILLLIAASKTVSAEGYAVNLMGTKQNAMGHIGTGYSLGASDIFFNPGAVAFSENKYQFEFGGSLVSTKGTFTGNWTGANKEKTDSPIGTPFYFYGSAKISEKFAAGLGIYTPFGNSLKWKDNFTGHYLIKDISLRAIFIQPTVSYKINDIISIGAGFVYVDGNLDLNRDTKIYAPAGHPLAGQDLGDANVNLKGSPKGYGYNLGIYLKPSERLSLGITYRSEIDMDIDKDGDATLSSDNEFMGQKILPNNIESKFSSGLPLAASLNVGGAYKLTEKFTLAADVNYIFWDSYKSLDFTFESPAMASSSSSNPKKYENTFSFRLGGDYKVSEKFTARAGLYYDMTPIQDKYYAPETPGANKTGISAGFTFSITEKVSVDGSLLYLSGKSDGVSYPIGSSATYGGDYTTQAWVPSLGVTIKL